MMVLMAKDFVYAKHNWRSRRFVLGHRYCKRSICMVDVPRYTYTRTSNTATYFCSCSTRSVTLCRSLLQVILVAHNKAFGQIKLLAHWMRAYSGVIKRRTDSNRHSTIVNLGCPMIRSSIVLNLNSGNHYKA